jgi:hypothetical protein
MRTDRLIDCLVADLAPADQKLVLRKLVLALSAGLAAAFGQTFLVMDVYQELQAVDKIALLCQFVLASIVIVIAVAFLLRAVNPGSEIRGFAAFAVLPLGAIIAVLPLGIAMIHRPISDGILPYSGAPACLIYIPLFAVVPFALIGWALRSGAPTHLARTGAVAGLLAGALSAFACALPCSNTLFVALALYHGVALELCAGMGARVGSSALRW